ncbi:MAG: LysR family transcriptional regulator [Burkholderiales bacterium]
MDFGDLDLNLLRVFDAVLRERSVTAAGTAMSLSQPAMSNALARLRRHFDDALLVRTAGGMQPTALAKELAPPIRQALALIESAVVRERGFDPTVSDRTFRFHMSDIGEMVFLPPILELAQREAPNVRMEVSAMAESALADAMAAGEIDLAMGFLPRLTGPIRATPLFSDPYFALVRADHPRIGARFTRAAFESASHCLVQSIGSGHGVIEEALRRHGLEQRIALRLPHFTVVPMILERTDLVVSVPARVARIFASMGRFRALPLPVPVPHAEVKLHWHERFDQDPGSRWLRERIIALHQDASPKRRNRKD